MGKEWTDWNRWLERVSRTSPESDPEASEIEEGTVRGEQMLMTNQQSAELAEPCVGSLHDPATNVSSQFAPIFVAPLLVVRKRESNAPVLLPAAVMKLWHERRAGSGTASTAQFIGDPAVGGRVCRERIEAE